MRRTEEETKLFYKCHNYCLSMARSRKDAYLYAERLYKNKTGKRYYKSYAVFRSCYSRKKHIKALD